MHAPCHRLRPALPASQINLVQSTSSTLPFENGKQIRTICVSPDGRLLLSIDQDGRALVVNRKRRALLHHFSFKAPVRAAKFSPDGNFVACAVGRLLQVRPYWCSKKVALPGQGLGVKLRPLLQAHVCGSARWEVVHVAPVCPPSPTAYGPLLLATTPN